MCTSNDEFGRNTVIELVEGTERIFTVGRLDYDTSGVLLLTNDGDFANEIIHSLSFAKGLQFNHQWYFKAGGYAKTKKRNRFRRWL